MRRLQCSLPLVLIKSLVSASVCAKTTNAKATTNKGATTADKSAAKPTKKPKTTTKMSSTTTTTATQSNTILRDEKGFVYPRKLVAIGDIRGDLRRAHAVLQECGAVDDNFDWAGGAHMTLVQTGNLLCNDSDPIGNDCAVVEKFMRLQKQAASEGGFLEVLHGDTESTLKHHGWRRKEHYATIKDSSSVMSWLNKRPLVYTDMGCVFVHGWVSPESAHEKKLLLQPGELWYWRSIPRIVFGLDINNANIQEDCDRVLKRFGGTRLVSGLPMIFSKESRAVLGERLLLTGVEDRADIDTEVRYIVMTQDTPGGAVTVNTIQKGLHIKK